MKGIYKDLKDKHTLQMQNKIDVQELLKFYSTFKPSDYPFDFVIDDDDEPISLKNKDLWKYPTKLPTYRFKITDNKSFFLSLKLFLSIFRLQSASDKTVEFFTQL